MLEQNIDPKLWKEFDLLKDNEKLTETILVNLKGMDVDDAISILENCKQLILMYSVVSFPWDRVKFKNEELSKC